VRQLWYDFCGFERADMKLDRIEKLEPCPYLLSPWATSGKKIDWMVKKFHEPAGHGKWYWDLILFKDGKPSETFRLFGVR